MIQTIQTLSEKLKNVKKNGNNKSFKALCPSHDDQKESLTLTDTGDKILLHCHAGCSFENICAALAIEPKDLFINKKQTKNPIVEIYNYKDENNNLLYQYVRFKSKKIRPRRFENDKEVWNLKDTRRVLYRLPELLKADKKFPVFICEGEKDVENIRKLGLTATCNPMGAGKWKNEYSQLLKGFDCVILPDNDEAGKNHATKVAKSLLGIAEQVRILYLPDLESKADVSDWIAKGKNVEDLFALLNGADVITGETFTENEDLRTKPNKNENGLPKNFNLREDGIFYTSYEKKKDGSWEEYEIHICSPMEIVADTCDAENNQWGKLIEFKDKQNVKHSIFIAMSSLSGDGTECRARLMDSGLIVQGSSRARQLFLQCILTATPKKHVLCVNQLGWHDDAFVLPDETISSNKTNNETEQDFLLQNVDRTANKFKPSGTLTDWQENIARLCVGNSRLMFAVCTAFAAAILPIAEETSGGFHLHGTSSTGKTTALLVAGSVWGGDKRKGFLETWLATSNGMEAVAEAHNHSLLLLDEISQVNPHEIGKVIYNLANDFGKSRMNKNISARRKIEWNLLFFSSGEKTLENIMQEIGQRLFAGQQRRFINIEADANAGLGLFENLHGFESSSDLAKFLSSASKRFYGAAIREFLQQVCDNRNFVEAKIKEIKTNFQSKIHFQDTSGEVYYVASRFALVTVAGMLASQFGVTNWKVEDVLACGEKIFDEWITTRGTTGSFDTAQGVKQVLSFIAQHGSSRFQSCEIKKDFNGNVIVERISNRAGFKRENYEGQTEFFILPEIFEGEICRGFSHIAVARELEKLGHLKRGTENSSLKSRETLPELGRKRVYTLIYEAISDEDDDETLQNKI